jgi:hypothetical protein
MRRAPEANAASGAFCWYKRLPQNVWRNMFGAKRLSQNVCRKTFAAKKLPHEYLLRIY